MRSEAAGGAEEEWRELNAQGKDDGAGEAGAAEGAWNVVVGAGPSFALLLPFDELKVLVGLTGGGSARQLWKRGAREVQSILFQPEKLKSKSIVFRPGRGNLERCSLFFTLDTNPRPNRIYRST